MVIDPLEDTAKFSDSAGRGAPTTTLSEVVVDLAGLTDRGRVRDNNEDCFLALEFGRHLSVLTTSLPKEDVAPFQQGGYALVVADGLGGMAAGEVASRMAVTGLLRLVEETPDWILSLEDRYANQVMSRVEQRMQQVADELGAEAEASPELRGMATTMTFAVSLGNEVLIAHVGDSRAYLLRDGQLLRLTRDHTRAQQLADLGIISPDAVATHSMRNVLTSCLGPSRKIDVDFRRFRLRNADRLLLCTDGLTDMVDDAKLSALLGAETNSEAACRALVDAALENGGRDNVTALLARYTIASPRKP